MTDSNTRRCAITGSTGYLGSRVVRRFRSEGWHVLEMARSASNSPSTIPYRLDSPLPLDAMEGLDTLIHCAYDFRATTPPAIQRTNGNGSVRLLKAAREIGVKTIIFISSMAAYDGCKSRYGSGKLAIEREAAKLDSVIVRPGMIYGKNAGGILASIRRAASMLPVVPLIGDGRYPVFTVHEEDLCGLLFDVAMRRVQSPDCQPISAAARETVPFRQMVTTLAAASGRKPFLLPIPWRIPFYGLRMIESLGLQPGFRSDSILSLVEANPSPAFSPDESLQHRFRSFSVEDL